jgi:hypothetical protein
MFPNGHAHVADTAIAFTRGIVEARRPGGLIEAEHLARRAVEIRETQLAPTHPKVAEARCWLGIVLAKRGRVEESAPLLREALLVLSKWGLADPADLAQASRSLRDAEATMARSGK